MTIIEAINGIDALKPNKYTQDQKIEWLKRLDGQIKEQVIDTHEGGEDVTIADYTTAPLTTQLLISAPYDEIYINYLAMKMDFAAGDFRKYNNNAVLYNESLSEYRKWYNRTHMPKGAPYIAF